MDGRVIIGTDPHKRSATIEVRDEREVLLATGRFRMDKTGYRQLLGYVRQWPARIWAVEGATGSAGRWRAAAGRRRDRAGCAGEVGRPGPGVRHRARPQDRRHRRALDRHGRRCAPGALRQLAVDEDLAVLRLLADRRDELSHSRTPVRCNRLHRLLAELVPGGAPRHLSAAQAKALLAGVRPRDLAGRTRRAAGGRADRRGRGPRQQTQGAQAAAGRGGHRRPAPG